MTPKFVTGQVVTNIYLGQRAEVTAVYTDGPTPSYDLTYESNGRGYSAVESVLSADMSQPFGVIAIEASLGALDSMVESATSARILGVLSNYQLERITDLVADAKHGIYERANRPTDYL